MPDQQQSDSSEFFVGYLPTPARTRRFLLISAGVLIALGGLLAAGIGTAQRDPGTGRWEIGVNHDYEGIYFDRPYPMLRLHDPANEDRLILLVGQGKTAGRTSMPIQTGQRVRGSAALLERDGWRMMELADVEKPIQVLEDTKARESFSKTVMSSKMETLRGEIIDLKCYLGAMKPGDGKTHKACAALCLRGGIPPAFRTVREDGSVELSLIVTPDGGTIDGADLEHLIELVGESVELRGGYTTTTGLRFLAIDLASIKRL